MRKQSWSILFFSILFASTVAVASIVMLAGHGDEGHEAPVGCCTKAQIADYYGGWALELVRLGEYEMAERRLREMMELISDDTPRQSSPSER